MTAATTELDETSRTKIRQFCQEGYACYDQQDLKTAIRHFFSAWTLIPKPQNEWQEAGWVLTALGDAYFVKGDYPLGSEALRSALHCPGTDNNPFIFLRLGQCLLELGEQQDAIEQLRYAYQIGGDALFNKEPEKYLSAIRDNA